MSFVIYDVETTGLNKRFDQILQFAAIHADADLVVTDQFDVRVRLMPHIVPSPTALHVNGLDISDVLNPELPSHYDAVCSIARALQSWSPSVFLGYNSIRFDEEFLRQALYMCLHPPFLTNTNGNTRGDILNLVRAAAVLAPGALQIPQEEGRACFRLEALAGANGFTGGAAHDAVTDVEAAIHLCRLVAERAPDLWSRFLRFAQRRAAVEFVTDEEVFVLFDQVGSFHSTHIVTSLGANPTRSALHFCLDLKSDIQALAAMEDTALAEAVAAQPRPIRRLRLNAAPLLLPLYEASADVLDGRSEDEYRDRALAVRENKALAARLLDAALAGEHVYADSPHVEEQIYAGNFPSDEEAATRQRFHDVDWPLRREIAAQFTDPRHRALAVRLFYLERPELLSGDQRLRMSSAIARRRKGEAEVQPACLTVSEALTELEGLQHKRSEADALRLSNLRTYLNSLL